MFSVQSPTFGKQVLFFVQIRQLLANRSCFAYKVVNFWGQVLFHLPALRQAVFSIDTSSEDTPASPGTASEYA